MIGEFWSFLCQQQIQQAIAIWGGVTGTQSFVGGLRASKDMKTVVAELRQLSVQVDRLSKHVYAAPNSPVVSHASKHPSPPTGAAESKFADPLGIKDQCEALAQKARSELLTSALIWAPDKFDRAFQSNPANLLVAIRRAGDAIKMPKDKNLLPVIFQQGSDSYVGWQKRSVLEHVFEIRVDELQWTAVPPTVKCGLEDTVIAPMPSSAEISGKIGPFLVRCPACQTVFRIQKAEAQARYGRVRCGNCLNAFNAFESKL